VPGGTAVSVNAKQLMQGREGLSGWVLTCSTAGHNGSGHARMHALVMHCVRRPGTTGCVRMCGDVN
jgi:hypothetical protein